MRKTVVALIVLSAALVVLCGYLAYSVVDQAVSLEYARAEQKHLEEDRALLAQLALDLAKGAKRRELEEIIRRKYGQRHIIKEEGSTLFVDGVGLRFQGDELIAIEFMNDASKTPSQR